MQIRRDIVLPIAFGVLFVLLPYVVPNMPKWIAYTGVAICVLVIVAAITPIWDRILPKKHVATPRSDVDYDNIYKIMQSEPSKKPPLAVDIALVFCGVVILAYGIWIIYVRIAGNTLYQVSPMNLLLFILFFILFPLWFLIDTVVIQRRQEKLGRSMVATKPKSLSVREDIDVIFNKSLKAIDTMQGSIITMDRPRLLKAQLSGSIMTVTTTNMGHGHTRVNFVCDSKWITTKIDFGKNQRYANTFERLLQTAKDKSGENGAGGLSNEMAK